MTERTFEDHKSQVGAQVQGLQWSRRFELSKRLVRFAWAIHVLLGLIALILLELLHGQSAWDELVRSVALALGGVPGMLGTMARCGRSSAGAIVITGVVCATGHVLIIAIIFRAVCGTMMSFWSEGHQSSVHAIRLIEWLFWMPAGFLLGIGVYWVTFISPSPLSPMTCISDPQAAWVFRIIFSSLTPYFLLLSFTTLSSLVVLIYWRLLVK